METKLIYQSSLQKIFFITLILLFSYQALCSETNSKTTTKKSEPQQQSEKKEQAVVQATKPRVSPSSFRPDMPLREAINILRNSTNPPLNIVVKWRDLDDNADINPDTLIGMDGLSRVSLKTHISVLLMSLSTESAELGYIVDGNVIIIGIKENLPKKMVTRVYDIADVVAPPSMPVPMMGMGNMSPYGNMMGSGNMSSPYGNMSGLNSYGSGYNQNYMNRGYTNQGNRSYGNMNTPIGIGIPMM